MTIEDKRLLENNMVSYTQTYGTFRNINSDTPFVCATHAEFATCLAKYTSVLSVTGRLPPMTIGRSGFRISKEENIFEKESTMNDESP